MYVQISTTNKCNARCSFCYQGTKEFTREQGVMKWEIFVRIVSENPGDIFNLSMFGEPLMDYDIIQRVKFIRDMYPNAEIYFHTNGQLLTEEECDDLVSAGLSRIVISCYGLKEQHDRLQKGTKFEHVAEMAEYMAKKIPVLIASNLVEEMDTKKIDFFWRTKGCSTCFDSGMDWGDGKEISKLSGYSSCAIAQGTRIFFYDGSVGTCCFDFNGVNAFGNIMEDRYENLLKRIKDRKFTLCRTCQYKEIFDNFRQNV